MTELPLPADVLPHRPPFLFVTELTAVEPASRPGAMGTDR